MTTTNHFRPHADFIAELEAYNTKIGAKPKPRALEKGDRVIVIETGWDGVVQAIDEQAVYVLMDHGPVRGLTDFRVDQLEYWSSNT